jgi:starvation-inducible outer membrane lipoprotein
MARNTSARATCAELVSKANQLMTKFILFAAAMTLALTSCTTVVHEPAPATTTTVHETTAVTRPSTTTQTTTTRSGGY